MPYKTGLEVISEVKKIYEFFNLQVLRSKMTMKEPMIVMITS